MIGKIRNIDWVFILIIIIKYLIQLNLNLLHSHVLMYSAPFEILQTHIMTPILKLSDLLSNHLHQSNIFIVSGSNAGGPIIRTLARADPRPQICFRACYTHATPPQLQATCVQSNLWVTKVDWIVSLKEPLVSLGGDPIYNYFYNS